MVPAWDSPMKRTLGLFLSFSSRKPSVWRARGLAWERTFAPRLAPSLADGEVSLLVSAVPSEELAFLPRRRSTFLSGRVGYPRDPPPLPLRKK